MALQGTYIDVTGGVFNEAYARIEGFAYSKMKIPGKTPRLICYVNVYVNKNCADDESKTPVNNLIFMWGDKTISGQRGYVDDYSAIIELDALSPEGKTPVKNLYEVIKLFPDFEGWTDV